MWFIDNAYAAEAAPGGMEGFLVQVVPLIIIFALKEHFSVVDTNLLLIQYGEKETLY